MKGKIIYNFPFLLVLLSWSQEIKSDQRKSVCENWMLLLLLILFYLDLIKPPTPVWSLVLFCNIRYTLIEAIFLK